jgi:hypothetical protein
MKKITFIILLFIPFLTFSQALQKNAPWMKETFLKKKGVTTFSDVIISAEKYFNTIDRDKKGSGLKPFERWKYHSSFYLNDDGTMASPEKLWTAWRQKNKMKTANTITDNSDWKSVGPHSSSNTYSSSTLKSSGQGRINVIAVDPSNPDTYYAGSPAGGIWKSTNAGSNWVPLSDYLPQIGVSGIAIHPTDSNIIYIATGDDDANDSYSVGVMKSIDGGITWNATGAMDGSPSSMNEIYIDPTNHDTLLIATNRGVFKTSDGGDTWTKKLNAGILDLKMKPGDPTIWYAVSSTSFYKSTDAGETFTEVIISSLLDSESNSTSTRLTIDVTIADSNYVYMVSAGSGDAFNGIYKSTDSGTTFTKTNETSDIFNSDQAWYDLTLTVSSVDKNTIYVGVLDIWKSTDGGDDFNKLTTWYAPDQASYTHADIHFLRFIDGKFFAGTDGGVYVSTNEGVIFTDLTKTMGISQFYKISVSPQNSNNIVGGIQDNGGMAFNENTWRNYHGGDGMEGNAHPTEPNTHYGFTQNGGNLYKTTTGGKSNQKISSAPAAEVGTGDSGGEWVTPMAINSAGVVYAGYKKLYKIVDNNWVEVSSSLLLNDDIDQLEIDPNEDNNIYLSEKSTFFRSTDGGVNFTAISFPGSRINSIEISNNDSNIAWVVSSGGVYKSINILEATPTFTNITGNLPSESKLVIRHHPGHKDNRVYLGTTLGVYYIDDTLPKWQTFDNKFPNVAVRDIEINEKDSKLYAATYGRGVFTTDIPKSLPSNDVKLVSLDSPINNSKSCGTVSPIITVKNQGSNTITSISVNYNIDGGSNSVWDWSGTLASEASTQITIPQFGVSKGDHVINIETTITNDLYSSNNSGSNSFNITELNTTPTTINSFETSNDELLVETSGDSGTDLWQRGAPSKTLLNSAGTGTNAYITKLVGNHPDKTTGYLYTKCYDLTSISNPVLSFKMAFDIEQDWDHMYVEYTTDQGQTWAILGTAADENWYNSSATTDASGGSDLPGKQWTGEGEKSNSVSGTNATIHNYTYDLAAFKNEPNVLFRFKFIADDLTNEEGAMIDDLVITGVLPVHEFDEISGLSIYPNPSSSIFNINWAQGNDFSISIFDITGKLLLQDKSNSKSLRTFSLDMSKFSKGIYFAKIKVDDKQSTKKLLLK